VKTCAKTLSSITNQLLYWVTYGRESSDSLLFGGWRGIGFAAAVLYSPVSALNILADL
jgi:hypothetical protein